MEGGILLAILFDFFFHLVTFSLLFAFIKIKVIFIHTGKIWLYLINEVRGILCMIYRQHCLKKG